MKLTTFSLLSICMAYVHGCVDNDFADEGCSDYEYIEKITCKDDSCTCKTYDELGNCASITDDELEKLKPADLNGAKCEEICLISEVCKFFRWDKAGLDNSVCTLMNDQQCTGFLECDRGQCLSGQAGCHGAVNPVPDDAFCGGKVQFLSGHIHWFCTFEDEPINIYVVEKVPTGTVCHTAHKCADFANGDTDHSDNSFFNELVVECNPTQDPVAPYLWGKNDECLYEVNGVAIDGATLIDPECTEQPDPLHLAADKLTEPGVSLVCDVAYTTDASTATVTVTAPNACVLLCNFHHVFSFESELASDGTGVWNKYDVGSDDGHELAEADVHCWDFMKI